MTSRHGLTLVEVLLATVLLTAIATTCVPLMSRAAEQLALDEPSVDLAELSVVADAILDEPNAVGFGSIAEIDSIEIPWPEAPTRRWPIVVRRICPADEDSGPSDPAWLAFSCDGWTVLRWLERPETEEASP